MVHRKTRWKWHECLEARGDILSNDSECENDDSVKNTLITTYQQDLVEKSVYESNSNDNVLIKQEKLKEEATLAFVISAKMARMQVAMEREVYEKKRSALYDLLGIDININKPLPAELLEEMNLGQLQVIVNELYCQIEGNNDELINLLIDRDALSMEQDSILVDIEDLTRRIQERTKNPPKQSSEFIQPLKRPEAPLRKKSLFQNIFRKSLFI